MRPFEIYNAEYVWNNCADMRPWLIVESRPGQVFGCFPIASECYGGSCFEVAASHPDFLATGLTKSCYIIDTHIFEVPLSNFKRRRGELAGRLLADFRQFSGV